MRRDTLLHACRWNRFCDEALLRGADVRGLHPPKEAVRHAQGRGWCGEQATHKAVWLL